MKKLAVILCIISSSITYASNSLTSTLVKISVGPSKAQLETARQILKEAIEALEEGDEELYKEKLKKAKHFQKFQKKNQTINAAFITEEDSQKINYFSELYDSFSSIRYDVMIEETCYVGKIEDAIKLLEIVIDQDGLNYDEQWYESPVAAGKVIEIQAVDGPNDLQDTREIKACK